MGYITLSWFTWSHCERRSPQYYNIRIPKLLISKVYKVISNVKNVFLKTPSRVKLFKNTSTDLSLPPEPPITTMWGSLVKTAVCYCEHREILKSIVNSTDKEQHKVSIKNTQK